MLRIQGAVPAEPVRENHHRPFPLPPGDRKARRVWTVEVTCIHMPNEGMPGHVGGRGGLNIEYSGGGGEADRKMKNPTGDVGICQGRALR